jgi:thiosulfate/3-mercaptopyruvate sulfurtransferase
MSEKIDGLVSTAWLAAHLGADDLKLLDGTWYLPMQQRDARAEYRERHIPGAVFFDLDAVADTASDLPHMLPAAEAFAAAVGALGIGNEDRVVVYDNNPMMSAPRVWWTFRAFGHAQVAVLDGGLPKWLSEGRPVEAGEAQTQPKRYSARLRPEMVRNREQMRENLTSRREHVIDARAAGRFTGAEPDLWPGRRRGHIPGSANLPYTELLEPASKTFLPRDRLAERFAAAGVQPGRPIATTCGSGVTASVLALGLHLTGRDDVAVYDGSWAEWGQPGDTPVETGEGAAR